MRPEAEKKKKRIMQFSQVFRKFCQGFLALAALGFLASIVASLAGRGTILAFDTAVPLSLLALPQRLIMLAIIGLAMGALLKGLYNLQRLFGSYAHGEVFTRDAVSDIRQLGIAALLWAAANVIWTASVPSLLVSQPIHVYEFHPDSLVIGIVVIGVSWFMEMAVEMREENELTI